MLSLLLKLVGVDMDMATMNTTISSIILAILDIMVTTERGAPALRLLLLLMLEGIRTDTTIMDIMDMGMDMDMDIMDMDTMDIMEREMLLQRLMLSLVAMDMDMAIMNITISYMT